MALLNTSLPNLIGGVSQQPDSVRFEGQCEEQTNAISSVVDGLSKRPNTRHIAKLVSAAIDADSFVHFIDRSDAEKYVVIHDGSYLKAFNLDGTPCTINGASSFATTGLNYIDSTLPKEDLKQLERDAVQNSDAQVVKLVTRVGNENVTQYIVKDDVLRLSIEETTDQVANQEIMNLDFEISRLIESGQIEATCKL